MQHDPERGLSRDAGFLRASYDRFSALLPDIDPCDLTFDTEIQPAEQITAVIAAQLLDPTAAPQVAQPYS